MRSGVLERNLRVRFSFDAEYPLLMDFLFVKSLRSSSTEGARNARSILELEQICVQTEYDCIRAARIAFFEYFEKSIHQLLKGTSFDLFVCLIIYIFHFISFLFRGQLFVLDFYMFQIAIMSNNSFLFA